jgi:hypothetical protein
MALKELNIKKPSTIEERDELIGRGLSKQMITGATAICPPMEDIATLIDGTLEGDVRDQLMKHLAGCERCFEVFQTSKELMEVEGTTAKKSMFTLVSSIIAVAAVLVIAVTISLQGNIPVKTNVAAVKDGTASKVQPLAVLPNLKDKTSLHTVAKVEAYVPITASDSADMLARADNIGHLVESISSGSSSMYGFSGATPPDKISFRLGVHATDLELLLRGNDSEGAVPRLKQVIEFMRQLDKNRAEVKRLAEIQGRVEAGETPHNFVGCTAGIEKGLVTDSDRFLYHFGVWAEGGRLASISGNKGYVTARSISYVKLGVKGIQLPPGVANALGEIEAAVRRGELTDKDFVGMKQSFEDIVAMY